MGGSNVPLQILLGPEALAAKLTNDGYVGDLVHRPLVLRVSRLTLGQVTALGAADVGVSVGVVGLHDPLVPERLSARRADAGVLLVRILVQIPEVVHHPVVDLHVVFELERVAAPVHQASAITNEKTVKTPGPFFQTTLGKPQCNST